MSIIDTAKEHPGMAIGVGVVAIVAIVWVMSSGSGAPSANPAMGAVDGGTALNDQLAASQQHSQDLQASLQASAQHDTSLFEQAKLALEGYNNNQQTQRFQIESETAAAMHASTLNAAVQTATINGTIRQSEIASNQAVTMSQIQAHSQETLVNALTATQIAGIKSNQAIQTQSWFDKIF